MDVLQRLVTQNKAALGAHHPCTPVLQQMEVRTAEPDGNQKHVLYPCKPLQEGSRGVNSKHPCPHFGQSSSSPPTAAHFASRTVVKSIFQMREFGAKFRRATMHAFITQGEDSTGLF
jgi:hypothetical protein